MKWLHRITKTSTKSWALVWNEFDQEGSISTDNKMYIDYFAGSKGMDDTSLSAG